MGNKQDRRPRDLAVRGQVEAVLVHSPDRLSRKYAYQVPLAEALARRGVVLTRISHQKQTKGASGSSSRRVRSSGAALRGSRKPLKITTMAAPMSAATTSHGVAIFRAARIRNARVKPSAIEKPENRCRLAAGDGGRTTPSPTEGRVEGRPSVGFVKARATLPPSRASSAPPGAPDRPSAPG